MKFRIYFEVLEQSFLFSNLIKKLYKDAEVELVNTKISTTKKFTIAKNLYPSMCLKDFDGIVSYLIVNLRKYLFLLLNFPIQFPQETIFYKELMA